MTPTSNPSPQDQQAYLIRENLAKLEAALLDKSPEMPALLRNIHSQLKKDSALVTILSDEECAILVSGLKKQTSTEIAITTLAKKPKKAMSKMSIGLDL